MHVARTQSSHVDKQGRTWGFESLYLVRSHDDAGPVKHERLPFHPDKWATTRAGSSRRRFDAKPYSVVLFDEIE
jgi:hypothetical protein